MALIQCNLQDQGRYQGHNFNLMSSAVSDHSVSDPSGGDTGAKRPSLKYDTGSVDCKGAGGAVGKVGGTVHRPGI
eukprot:10901095-Heterocapsa_arctica.AAC.1